MNKISGFRYTPLPEDSPYVKPFRMYYIQDGKEKSWDMLKVHDSVAIIIFNKTRNNLVLVRQFRPGNGQMKCHFCNCSNSSVYFLFIFTAVYHAIISSDPNHKTASPESLMEKYPVSLAITNELCAGIVDKSKPLIEIAKEEILEECGYNVPVERIELVMSYR